MAGQLTVPVRFYATESDAERVDRAARSMRMTRSAIARLCMLYVLGPPDQVSERMVRALREAARADG